MTLTRISLLTALVTAVVNLLVLFGVDLTADQLAGINAVLLALGAVVHSWFNPEVPLGVTKPDDPNSILPPTP